jgi:hypothetical protein
MIGGPMDGPHALALNERLLELLADAGLDPVDAARAAYLLIVYVFGSIALEVAAHQQPGPLPPEPERIATRHGTFAATPAHHYPRAAAAAATLAGYISTEQYLWGLCRVLDGITPRPVEWRCSRCWRWHCCCWGSLSVATATTPRAPPGAPDRRREGRGAGLLRPRLVAA